MRRYMWKQRPNMTTTASVSRRYTSVCPGGSVCVCVCVCERERERERGRWKEKGQRQARDAG